MNKFVENEMWLWRKSSNIGQIFYYGAYFLALQYLQFC